MLFFFWEGLGLTGICWELQLIPANPSPSQKLPTKIPLPPPKKTKKNLQKPDFFHTFAPNAKYSNIQTDLS
jgi:hypothetical protein